MLIERINQMIEIKEIQNEYCAVHGAQPYNVSSWLTCDTFSKSMLAQLKMPEVDTIEYVYTYSIDGQLLNSVKSKLDPSACDESGITLVDNGTQAIITLVNLIKQYGYKKICIVNPAYFSIAQALKAFDMEYDCVNLQRVDGQYVLPFEELVAARYDVIWLTSPVFSTSVYFGQDIVDMMHRLMDMGVLIVSDECFCVPGNELTRRVANRDNFIAIYAPHKSLCINTMKFSAIIYPARFDMFIEHWVDVLTGNLPASSLSAIAHFMDPNYEDCLNVYKGFMTTARDRVQAVIDEKDSVLVDKIMIGSLLTLYFKSLTFDQIKSLTFIKRVIFNTGTSFYPSFLNGLDETFGFAFRVNLALCDEAFLTALDCLVNHLDKQ